MRVSARTRQRPSLGRDRTPGAYFYVATTASLIYEILSSLALPPDTFAFVDMGSGKGRALLVASEFAFAKIVGIELSPHLHRIAQENIKRYSPASQQCTAFELHCMDVVDYRLRPRAARAVPLRSLRAGDRCRASLPIWRRHLAAPPREAFVVYIYPRFEDVLQGSSCPAEGRKKADPHGGPGAGMWSTRPRRHRARSARELAAAYAAAFTGWPLTTSWPARTVTCTFWPSLILPARICSASGSCTAFWITRFSGRAP